MLFPISNRHICLNLSSIIRDQPKGWNFSNPHVFHLNWVLSCTVKYTVSITAKFLMMNWKTGPCDPSNAYVYHTTPANFLYARFSHILFIYIYAHTYHQNPKPSLHILWYQILTFFSLLFVILIIFLSNTS